MRAVSRIYLINTVPPRNVHTHTRIVRTHTHTHTADADLGSDAKFIKSKYPTSRELINIGESELASASYSFEFIQRAIQIIA